MIDDFHMTMMDALRVKTDKVTGEKKVVAGWYPDYTDEELDAWKNLKVFDHDAPEIKMKKYIEKFKISGNAIECDSLADLQLIIQHMIKIYSDSMLKDVCRYEELYHENGLRIHNLSLRSTMIGVEELMSYLLGCLANCLRVICQKQSRKEMLLGPKTPINTEFFEKLREEYADAEFVDAGDMPSLCKYYKACSLFLQDIHDHLPEDRTNMLLLADFLEYEVMPKSEVTREILLPFKYWEEQDAKEEIFNHITKH